SAPEMLEAPLICAGVCPLTDHGALGRFTSWNPAGNAYGDSSWAQKADSGGALRKPGLGGAFGVGVSGRTKNELSSRPRTPVTAVASELGIDTSASGDRSGWPRTRYRLSVVPNAAFACATVPSAAT